MSAKQYARLVPKAHRAQRTPVIDRPMRPRMIAWAGPAAFYPNRLVPPSPLVVRCVQEQLPLYCFNFSFYSFTHVRIYRFYEIDKWYKGRIDKPEQVPKLHVIDPTNHLHSLAEFLESGTSFLCLFIFFSPVVEW